MKKVYFIVSLLYCVVSIANAQLVFQSDVKEFHPDIKTAELNADFPFTNSGSTPITIKEIKPSCGCTVATSDKVTYAPGEKGVIKAVYAVHGSLGFQQKEIAVRTVEDPNSVKILTIKAYIPEVLAVSPKSLSWAVGDATESKNFKVDITYDKPASIVGIEWTTDRFIAKLKTVVKDKSYDIQVEPLATNEPVEGSIVIKVQLPDSSTPKLVFIPFSVRNK